MLVLTRKLMEKLYIGGDICVTVVRLEGSQVRLGIEAPRDIPVIRAELKRHSRPLPRTVAPSTPADLAVGLEAISVSIPGGMGDAQGPADRVAARAPRPQPIRLRKTS